MTTFSSRSVVRPLFAAFGAIVLLSGLAPMARVAPVAADGCISLTTDGSAYTQNFDTLSNVAGSTTNNLTIPGWSMTETGGGARDNEQYGVDTGGSTTGDTYSYGAAASTERALGQLRSGTLIPLFGAAFANSTGSPITSLDVAYTGEQWRLGTAGRTDQMNFQYSLDASDLNTGTWTNVAALNFVTPDTATAGAKNGNAAADRTQLTSTITGLNVPNGACFWIRWTDTDATGGDDGLAVDDFSLVPHTGATTPNLTIDDVSLNEGDAGTTVATFTVSLSVPAAAGGVTFDIATANDTAQAPSDYTAKSLTSQTIPAGSSFYAFDVLVNGDTTAEPNERFFVNVTGVTGATVIDGQGQGVIQNDDVATAFIHDVQGNGSASPLVGATVAVQAVVVANFQGTNKLQGFFVQEEDSDVDADPNTSEGIFVFCGSCPTPVFEGDQVRVTGAVSEFNGMTEITASAPGSIILTSTGNTVTPSSIDLPIAGDVNAFYEAREGMKVTFVDTLTVSEYFELARYGQIILYEGGRPEQFTESNAPDGAGLAAHTDDLARREVVLDDDSNLQESYLSQVNGFQSVYYPTTNGGFSVGSQGTDFFRGGDTVSGLTGVLQWGTPGTGSGAPETWRIRPTRANPASFTTVNPRPATPPAVGGAIKAVGMNLLNYFTTIDTTASNSTGPCGPAANVDCRGADSVAELNRQRDRASIVVCSLNADVYGFMELENTTPNATITDLLGAVNARCGGAYPYTFVDTGGTLGTDAIRVELVYRTGILSPVGSPLVDLDPIHNRPPTAQTFDVVDASNIAFGQRFTVVANHFKSKGCDAAAIGSDADAGDGQSCYNGRRTAQASRLLTWINGTVLPAAGDPDVLLLGDFNSYSKEDPITTLEAGGYTDLAASMLGPGSYSYLFDGQLGHLDYGFASPSLVSKVTGIGNWHINADEVPLFDYNDEVLDSPGEASFDEKPDGSALVPPRVVFQPGTPYRASDHDPVIVGLFSDTTPPDTTIDTKPSNPSNLSVPTFTFSGTDDVTPPQSLSFECDLDDAGFAPCTSPQQPTLGDGPHSFAVRATDGAGNVDGTPDAYDWIIDSTAPSVTIDAAAAQPDPTGASPINFTVTFSQAVSGFDQTDVSLGGSAGATSAVVTGGPTTYNVAVSGMTSDGTVIASISAGSATDAAGNFNTASTSGDNTVTYDATAPTVTIDQASGQADPSNTTPINFTVVFSESTSDFATGDVTISGTAGGVKTATVTGSGTTYNVAVTGMTSDGTVIVTIAAGVATDSVGNPNTDSTSADNTVIWDATAPTVTINQAAGQADPAASGPINFTVVFSESLTDFATGDVTITGSAGGTKTATVTGGGTTYNVAVTGMTTSGTVVASIVAGVATDAAENGNTASTSSDNTVTYAPNRPPTATVAGGQCATGKVSGSIALSLADPDGDGLTLALDSNSNTALVPNANVVITGSSGSRSISVTAKDKASGVATLTFRLSDGTVNVALVVTVRVGTGASETLNGTDGIDMIFGSGGKDTINGLGGADLLCGGKDVDTMNGGAGNDTIDGADANDTLNGGADNDTLNGVGGNDLIDGADGNDVVNGGAGNDTLNGGAGNDLIDGGDGADIVNGGADNDILRGGRGDDRLTGGTGADSFSGGDGRDTVSDFDAGQGDTQDATIP